MKTKLANLARGLPWKSLSILVACAVALVLLIAAGVWVRDKSRARPLYGVFDIDSRCIGGHESFLTLEETAAYDDCPGHRIKKNIGRVERSGNEAIVHSLKDDSPWLLISWDGNSHFLTVIDLPGTSGNAGTEIRHLLIPQVTNPFRTRLPRYLPEE